MPFHRFSALLLALVLCLLPGCAAQPAAPAQSTIPHIETPP